MSTIIRQKKGLIYNLNDHLYSFFLGGTLKYKSRIFLFDKQNKFDINTKYKKKNDEREIYLPMGSNICENYCQFNMSNNEDKNKN